MAKKRLYHIPVLIVLSVIFLGILFLSTSQKGVSIEYSFIDETTTGKERIEIGEVTVRNSGKLPAKVELKTLQGCNFEGRITTEEIYIDYMGSKSRYDYYYNGAEVPAGEEITYSIGIGGLLFSKAPGEEDFEGETIDVAIFEVEETTFPFNRCNDLNVEDAIKIVKVTVENEE